MSSGWDRWLAIYKIECLPVKRSYVGQTTCVYLPSGQPIETLEIHREALSRWKGHFDVLRKGKHSTPLMQQDFDTFGIEAFESTVLEWLPNSTSDRALKEREIYWQWQVHPEYSRDYWNAAGGRVLNTISFVQGVELIEGRSQVIANDDLKQIKDRLQWLEQRMTTVEKRQRRLTKQSEGQMQLFST